MENFKRFIATCKKLTKVTPYKSEQEGILKGVEVVSLVDANDEMIIDGYETIEHKEWEMLCAESNRLERVIQQAQGQLTGLKMTMAIHQLETRKDIKPT